MLTLCVDGPNGVFTLPDTKTDTENEMDIDTDKLEQHPMVICAGVCFRIVWADPHNSIQPIFLCLFIGLSLGQCENTISAINTFDSLNYCDCMDSYNFFPLEGKEIEIAKREHNPFLKIPIRQYKQITIVHTFAIVE